MGENRTARSLMALTALLVSSCQPGTFPGSDASTAAVTAVPRRPLGVGETRDAVWADLDGDHDLDLVVATPELLVRIFRNDDGALVEVRDAVDPSVARGEGFRLATGDVDGDGRADLVACSEAELVREGRGGKTAVARCHLLLNATEPGGPIRLQARPLLTDSPAVEPAVPLLTDIDGDGDLDILLLTTGPHAAHRVLRNDRDGATHVFAELVNGLPGRDARDAAVVSRPRRPAEIVVMRNDGTQELFVYDAERARFQDRAAELGIAAPEGAGPGVLAVGDFDDNRAPDVFVARKKGGSSLYLRKADGKFHDVAQEAGLDQAGDGVAVAIAENLNHDTAGAIDLLLAHSNGKIEVWLNQRSRDSRSVHFAPGGDFRTAPGVTALSVARIPEACDVTLDIVALTGPRGRESEILTFAGDSAGHTVRANGRDPTHAPFAGGCVEASGAGDTLIGHPRGSVLLGGNGDDTLIARGGVTIMRGGPGADRFVASGATIIRLPPEDIAPGDTIVCDPRETTLVDTTMDRQALERAGVRFEGCFRDNVCPGDAAEASGAAQADGFHDDAHCDGPRSKVALGPLIDDRTSALKPAVVAFHLLHNPQPLLPVTEYDGPGVATCRSDKDCWKFGLEVCLDENLNPLLPFPGSADVGQCYPGDEDGIRDAIYQWCDDPYFARNRFDDIENQLTANQERYVIPLVFWIPRSSAVTASGACVIRNATPPKTLQKWHDDVATSMDGVIRLYSKWGITFSFQVRTFTVSSSGPFVDDANPCLTKLTYAKDDPNAQWDPAEPNRVEDLVAAVPFAYIPGQINAYAVDVGTGWGESSSFLQGSVWRPFILLHGGIGAAAHELGHALHLGHPYDGNLGNTGLSPDAESRDAWPRRPYPDAPLAGLQLCQQDSDCSGFDAPPGECHVPDGQAFGYCFNLKKDCALGGDHICDTPWDSRPCYTDQGRYQARCTDDADCRPKGWKGEDGLWSCGIGGKCVRFDCTANADCPSGMCIQGRCANTFFTDAPTCCDVHADTATGKFHNKCWEKLTGGSIVPAPGVGVLPTGWPAVNTAMTYHAGVVGVPGSFTLGQRDHIVCKMGYDFQYGWVRLKPNGVGQPCSLLPGATSLSYGSLSSSRLVPHGACQSGVCGVNHDPGSGLTFATCVASSCTDGLTGSEEADVDCGGVCLKKCSVGSSCRADSDCLSGSCSRNRCQPSCADGEKDGTELDVDEGGTGRQPGCGGRGGGETCRFGDDCGAGLICVGSKNCVDSSDCAGNKEGLFESTCTSNAECPGGLCISKFDVHCRDETCNKDSDCVSGRCDTLVGRCSCDRASECGPTDLCPIASGACTNECIDGRCLGKCEIGL